MMTSLFIVLNIGFNIGLYFVFDNVYFIFLNLIISFVLSFLVLVVIVLLCVSLFGFGKPSSKLKNFFLRNVFGYCLFMLRIKYEVVNPENIPSHNNFVLFPNHKSYCDVFVVFSAVKKPLSSVSKKEVYKIPILNKAMRGINVIPLDREDDRKAMQQMILAIKNLKNGLPMLIFPEGGRKNKEVQEMVEVKPGAYKLAMKNEADIVPVTLVNMYNIKHNYFRRRTNVKIIFHKPITYFEYKDKNTIEIGDIVFKIVNDGLK